MHRRHWINAALLVVAGALVTLLVMDREREAERPPLLQRDSDEVQRAGFRLHDQDVHVELERRNGGWHITRPVNAPADPLEINSLLSVLRARTHEAMNAADVDLAQLGLSAPARTLYFDDVEVHFGDVNPVTLQRYALVGERVVQIDDPAGAPQNTDHSNFVAKTVLPPHATLERVDLPEWTLRRGDDGSWQAEPKYDTQRTVSATTAERAAQKWQEARGMWAQRIREQGVVGDPVTLHLQDGESIELQAVRGQQLILARAEFKVQYHLARSLTELLLDLYEEDADDVQADAEAMPPELHELLQ